MHISFISMIRNILSIRRNHTFIMQKNNNDKIAIHFFFNHTIYLTGWQMAPNIFFSFLISTPKLKRCPEFSCRKN